MAMFTDRTLKFPVLIRCFPLLFLGMITACNAIEPERVSPQAKVQMPEIQTDPAYVDYLLEPYQGSWMKDVYPVVHMHVPKAPYYDPKSSSGPFRSYGDYIVMFYPNFLGLADPENAECKDVKGHCRRQMTVGFGLSYKGNLDDGRQREIMQEFLEKKYITPVDVVSPYPELELVGARGRDPLNNSAPEIVIVPAGGRQAARQ